MVQVNYGQGVEPLIIFHYCGVAYRRWWHIQYGYIAILLRLRQTTNNY